MKSILVVLDLGGPGHRSISCVVGLAGGRSYGMFVGQYDYLP